MLSLEGLREIISKPGLMCRVKKEASVAAALVVYCGLASPLSSATFWPESKENSMDMTEYCTCRSLVCVSGKEIATHTARRNMTM